MKSKKSSFIVFALLLCVALTTYSQTIDYQNTVSSEIRTKFDFANAPQVNVANAEELYAAVNNTANAGNQIVLAAGVYALSANDGSGAARPNGGRLELQENMALRGVSGNREAVVIDAANLPASSYTAPIANTGAIRMGKGTNAVEWLTVRNAVNGGAGIIVHLSVAGTIYVRIAHCGSTGNQRGVDIRNVNGTASYLVEAEIIDNDFYNNRVSTQQGLRIINTGGTGSNINAYLSGNRMFDNGQGLLVENIGSSVGNTVSVYSSGDRFYKNGGGVFVGGGFGTSLSGNTANFTAVNSVFENNNTNTDLYRGGLNVIGGTNTTSPNSVANNTANAVLRNCRFSNNQVADIGIYGAAAYPSTLATTGTNNRASVRLFGTPTQNLVIADSDPAPAGANSARFIRNSVVPNADFDGDGRTDLAVFRPSERTWYFNRSQSGFSAFQFGLATDKLVPADYDGDGKTDVAVYRNGSWYWINSSTNQFGAFQFGQASDVPQPADFDGDGKAEIAVFRLSGGFNGTWYVYNLATNQFTAAEFFLDNDVPVVGDYNGDGRADYATYSPQGPNQFWLIAGIGLIQWGAAGDKAVPADYDGDGKTDLAVFRPSNGTWYIRRSKTNDVQIIAWGLGTDAPVPADYDGDGKTDVAVYRNGTWFLQNSSQGFMAAIFGATTDKPIPNVFMQ